jgi:hypothetical protein
MASFEKLMRDAVMLADAKAYDAAKAPLEIGERRLDGEAPAKVSRVSRPMKAAIESSSKKGGVATLKKLTGALNVGLELLV